MVAEVHRNDIDAERKYLRPADVVKQTGMSKSSVMAALWSGQLEAYRLGRAWLVPVEAVDRWVRGGDSNIA
jgi:excisionase family DNA binding protein